jgi:hypothetical protein
VMKERAIMMERAINDESAKIRERPAHIRAVKCESMTRFYPSTVATT